MDEELAHLGTQLVALSQYLCHFTNAVEHANEAGYPSDDRVLGRGSPVERGAGPAGRWSELEETASGPAYRMRAVHVLAGNALSGERAIAEENLASQVHRTLKRAGS